MIRCCVGILAVVLAALCASSCRSSGVSHDGKPAVESVRPTLPSVAVTVKPAPSQDPEGGKIVRFDPCRSVGDDVVARVGFDPATRERSDQVHTGYAFISCGFRRYEINSGEREIAGFLDISSTNITMEQFRQREGSNASAITINGAEALAFSSKDKGCNVVTRGPDNSLDIMVSNGMVVDWRACDHVQEIAAVIDSSVNGTK